MNEKIKLFTIDQQKTILEALKKIDKNTHGFLIVLDEKQTVLGVLTDGDIRRALLNGFTLTTEVENIYRKNFTYLKREDSLAGMIQLFKNSRISFLPILDEQKQLCNLVTKAQMQALLLQDIQADLSYDFLSLDENLLNHEIYERPWGFYKTTVMNDYFQSKVISINPGQSLSLQAHKRREEYWICAHGTGNVQIGDSIKKVECGSSLFIPKGCRHRLKNTSGTDTLIIIEVQIGDYFGEDDIIRYEDNYGRV